MLAVLCVAVLAAPGPLVRALYGERFDAFLTHKAEDYFKVFSADGQDPAAGPAFDLHADIEIDGWNPLRSLSPSLRLRFSNLRITSPAGNGLQHVFQARAAVLEIELLPAIFASHLDVAELSGSDASLVIASFERWPVLISKKHWRHVALRDIALDRGRVTLPRGAAFDTVAIEDVRFAANWPDGKFAGGATVANERFELGGELGRKGGTGLEIAGMTFSIPGAAGTLSAAVETKDGKPAVTLDLGLRHLDGDRLRSALQTALPHATASMATPLVRLDALLGQGFTKGKDVDIVLAAKIDELVAQRTKLHGLAVSADIRSGQLVAASMRGGAPGDSTLAVEFRRKAPDEIDGRIQADSKRLQETIGWLGLHLGSTPLERARSAGFDGRLVWRPGRFELHEARFGVAREEGGRPDVVGSVEAAIALDAAGKADELRLSLDLGPVDIAAYVPESAVQGQRFLSPGTVAGGLKAAIAASVSRDAEDVVVHRAEVELLNFDIVLGVRSPVRRSLAAGDRGGIRGAALMVELPERIQSYLSPRTADAIGLGVRFMEELLSTPVARHLSVRDTLSLRANRISVREMGSQTLATFNEVAGSVGLARGSADGDTTFQATIFAGDSSIGGLHLARAELRPVFEFARVDGRSRLVEVKVGRTTIEGDAIDRLGGPALRRLPFALDLEATSRLLEEKADVRVHRLTLGVLASFAEADVQIAWPGRLRSGLSIVARSAASTVAAAAAFDQSRLAGVCRQARPIVPGPSSLTFDVLLEAPAAAGRDAPRPFLGRLRLLAQVGSKGTNVDDLDLRLGKNTGLAGRFAIVAASPGDIAAGGCLTMTVDPRADLPAGKSALPGLLPPELVSFAQVNDQAVTVTMGGRLQGTGKLVRGLGNVQLSTGRVSPQNQARAIVPVGALVWNGELALDEQGMLVLSRLTGRESLPGAAALISTLAAWRNEITIGSQRCAGADCAMSMAIDAPEMHVATDTGSISLRAGGLRLHDGRQWADFAGFRGGDVLQAAMSGDRLEVTLDIANLAGVQADVLQRLQNTVDSLLPQSGASQGHGRSTITLSVHELAGEALLRWLAKGPVPPALPSLTLTGVEVRIDQSANLLHQFHATGKLARVRSSDTRSVCSDAAGDFDINASGAKTGGVWTIKSSGGFRCIDAGAVWNLVEALRATPLSGVEIKLADIERLSYEGQVELPDRQSGRKPVFAGSAEWKAWFAAKLFDRLKFASAIYDLKEVEQGMPGEGRAEFKDGQPTGHIGLLDTSPERHGLPLRLAVDFAPDPAHPETIAVTATARSSHWGTETGGACSAQPLPSYIETVKVACHTGPFACQLQERAPLLERHQRCNFYNGRNVLRP